jgi:hypothetical protein
MAKRRTVFDVKLAIATAWDVIWVYNLKIRGTKDDYRGRSYYTTAADVVAQVRSFARSTLEGKPWDTSKPDTMHGYGSYLEGGGRFRMSGDLQGTVRSWLRNNHKIASHNFGRGHISGMHYRPVDQPIGPTEQKTLEKKAERRANPKPRPHHYGKSHGARAACVLASAAASGRRLAGWTRSKSWVTPHAKDVTCPRCLKLLAEQKAA